jgi:hypothetical protein
MALEKPLTGAERVAKRRATLRAQGLRQRTFWLPDPNSEAFKEQARREVEALNAWYAKNMDIVDEVMSLQVELPDVRD